MRPWVLACLLAAACGGGKRADRIPALAHEIPATARAVIAIDGARLRGTWLASSARAFAALVPPDRGCLIDAALTADRALVAELVVGRMIAIAADRVGKCSALSQVAPGVWIATLDGAAAPAAAEIRLDARPDFAHLARELDAPIAAVAPDGVPDAGVTFAGATIARPTHGELTVELDTDEHAARADAWFHDQIAAARPVLAEAAGILDGITVAHAGTSVTVTVDTDAATATRDGPFVAVAVAGALASRRSLPALETAPACVATHWPVTCTDALDRTLPASLRTTIEQAARDAHPAPRVEAGQPAGVRLGEVPADGVLAALGLRTGDAIIAADGRQLDTAEAIDDLVRRLHTARAVAITIERGAATFELHYTVQ